MQTDGKLIHYLDSHGCKVTFLTRRDVALVALKKRKFVYVLPEVVEIIERRRKRSGKEMVLENVSLELCVHPAIIYSIFMYLIRMGLLGKPELRPPEEVTRQRTLPGVDKDWVGLIYPILRDVKEEDYGTPAKKEAQ
jgi:hypothetical protein